jgi:hypothetical protein
MKPGSGDANRNNPADEKLHHLFSHLDRGAQE